MSRPTRRAGVRVVRSGDRFVLRLDDGRSVALNESALALWELCDGETDAEEMIDAVTEVSAGVDRQRASRDVHTTLERLAGADAITWSD